MLQYQASVSTTHMNERGANGRYEFPAEWLNQEEMNVFEFILPYNTSGGDSNFRNYSVSVM